MKEKIPACIHLERHLSTETQGRWDREVYLCKLHGEVVVGGNPLSPGQHVCPKRKPNVGRAHYCRDYDANEDGRGVPGKHRPGTNGTGAEDMIDSMAPNHLDCVHRGQQLREDECGSCKGKTSVKVYACSKIKSGETTIAGCNQCDLYEGPPLPPLVEPVRNLYFHLYPVVGSHTGKFFNGSNWRDCIQLLADRWHLFNGRKLVYVATGHDTYSFQSIKEEFAGLDCELFEVRNVRSLREVTSFPKALRALHTSDPNHITYVTHSKGVRNPTSEASTLWRDTMFHCMLDYPELVRELLDKHPICGTFKAGGGFNGRPGYKGAHYSGSFFCYRNAELWRRGWKCENYFSGIESWPGIMFTPAEMAVVFGENAGNLYHTGTWRSHVLPALQRWEAGLLTDPGCMPKLRT